MYEKKNRVGLIVSGLAPNLLLAALVILNCLDFVLLVPGCKNVDKVGTLRHAYSSIESTKTPT